MQECLVYTITGGIHQAIRYLSAPRYQMKWVGEIIVLVRELHNQRSSYKPIVIQDLSCRGRCQSSFEQNVSFLDI